MLTAARDLAKSETVTTRFKWLLVTTTTGNVVMDMQGGDTITLSAVPVGTWMPVGNALRIRNASTAVGFIVA
mgnify:FL=1|tara:strand:- start:187 stop:402 length:216 start_codon:yes stop_codon:yes gene_type:complete